MRHNPTKNTTAQKPHNPLITNHKSASHARGCVFGPKFFKFPIRLNLSLKRHKRHNRIAHSITIASRLSASMTNFYKVALLLSLLLPNGASAEEVANLTIIDQRQDAQHPICCWSGIETLRDGSLVIVSDQGILFTAEISFDALTLTVTDSSELQASGGDASRRERTDAEGFAVSQDGRAFISIERRHRIDEFNGSDPINSWPAPNFIHLEENGGFEALAVDPDGVIWAIAETPSNQAFPLLSLEHGSWQPRGTLLQSDGFLPVGADFDRNGNLYILERRLSLLGFSARLRRVNAPVALGFETTTIWESDAGAGNNFEGITVVESHGQNTKFLLVSDNNGMPFFQTRALLLTSNLPISSGLIKLSR